MPAKPLIQARIDAGTKEEAAAVLKAMGLTLSDAVRMTLVHAAREKALPFEPPSMRTIERTTQFERDHMREMKGRYRATRPADLTAVISDFAADRPLAPRLRDPALTGNGNDHRDCHVKPDLVPIDRRLGTETLQLVRLGSHAERGFRNNGPARNRAPMRLYRRLHRHSREVPVALFRGAAHDEPS